MRIAVPCVEGKLSLHFGHCESFALIDVDKKTRQIVKTVYETPPPHEPGVLPRWLAEKKVALIVAGGMGARAQGLFAQNGIAVVTGAGQAAPEEIVVAYLSGTLKTGPNACDH